MTEWWTYRLQDFLMFAPRTYYRLFELANAEQWPLHLLALAIGAAILALLAWPRWRHGEAVACALLALPWLWVGWAFLWQRYAPINWAAAVMAMLFVLEAALLLARAGARRGAAGCAGGVAASRRLRPVAVCAGAASAAGAGAGAAVAAGRVVRHRARPHGARHPRLAAACACQPYAQRTSARAGVLSWCVPLLWCLASGATLWAMGSSEAWLMPASAAAALGTVWRSRRPAA